MEKDHIKTDSARLAETATALQRNGFDAEVARDSLSAAESVLRLIGGGHTVGMGGSMTAEALGLPEALRKAGNEFITHTAGMQDAERRKTWQRARAADFYIASPQAVTANGELIFIDAIGNRVSSVIHGPGRVILLAGVNKLVGDMQAGLWRMRNVAAIPNNVRLKKDNPCVKTLRCEDCASPARICNVVVMLWKKPRLTDYKIILINEKVGY